MSQLFRRLIFIAASGLTSLALVLGIGTTATAVTTDAHGIGFLHTDKVSWIGSYRLSDGTRAFCLQAGKASPIGTEFGYVEGSTLGWFSSDDSARLAFISREWAATDDPITAAAAQLATWTISGLNGKDQSWYAARAGQHSSTVLQLAEAILERASTEASTAVVASLSVSVPEAGASSVRADLTAHTVGAGPTIIPSGSHAGTVTLTGAVFNDGSDTAVIVNGSDTPITPTGTDHTVSMTVSSQFDSLPYGTDFTVATPSRDVQNLLVARTATASASATADLTRISPLPFQPRIETVTSTALAFPGTHVTDVLTVTVAESEGTLSEWGVFETDDVMSPIPVIVESTLVGPFTERIEYSKETPVDAPVVCTVEVIATGVGEYRTPDCVLPAAGWYVWTEKIDPDRTSAEQGGARVLPWVSDFGIAAEITRAVMPVAPAVASKLANTGTDVGLLPVAFASGALPIGALFAALGRATVSRRTKQRKH
jgi:hypothetical protein